VVFEQNGDCLRAYQITAKGDRYLIWPAPLGAGQ